VSAYGLIRQTGGQPNAVLRAAPPSPFYAPLPPTPRLAHEWALPRGDRPLHTPTALAEAAPGSRSGTRRRGTPPDRDIPVTWSSLCTASVPPDRRHPNWLHKVTAQPEDAAASHQLSLQEPATCG